MKRVGVGCSAAEPERAGCQQQHQRKYKTTLKTIAADQNVKRIDVLPEGEAFLNAYSLDQADNVWANQEYIVVDAGGGTIDVCVFLRPVRAVFTCSDLLLVDAGALIEPSAARPGRTTSMKSPRQHASPAAPQSSMSASMRPLVR